jgi:hypothetical protein
MLAVDQHRVMHRLDQALKQLLAALQVGAPLFEIIQQLVDRSAQLFQRLGFALEPDSTGGAGFERQTADLLGKIADRTPLAPVPKREDAHAYG